MIGEIIEAKNGMYFVGSDIELIDIGPILFVAKNDVPAEDYSKLREMLKGVFLEKYYDYSAEWTNHPCRGVKQPPGKWELTVLRPCQSNQGQPSIVYMDNSMKYIEKLL